MQFQPISGALGYSKNVVELARHPLWAARVVEASNDQTNLIETNEDWEQRRFELIVARELAGEDFMS